MKADLYNQQNQKIGTTDLPDKAFKVKWNPDLVHQVLRVQLANRRKVLADTKDRNEVSGGGRKPWRQKGTGRARHGSIRSPLWRGGGVTFGPIVERKFARKINEKMKRLAVLSVLSKKLEAQEIKIIDNLNLEDFKTRRLAVLLKKIADFPKESVLLVSVAPAEKRNVSAQFSSGRVNIHLAARNLPKIKVLSPDSLNVYDLLKYQKIFFDQEAIGAMVKHYGKSL